MLKIVFLSLLVGLLKTVLLMSTLQLVMMLFI